MKSFIESLSFGKRIALILAIPLAGLLVFSVITLANHNSEARALKREIQTVQELTLLVSEMANTVHELQKERGRSAGYIGSNGEAFAKEIRSQHASSDSMIAVLRNGLERIDTSVHGPAFNASIDQGLDGLAALAGVRRRVLENRIPLSEAVSFYTGTIRSFLDTVGEVSKLTDNSELSLLLVSYSNFLHAKDFFGIERAILSFAFAKDEFTPEVFSKFVTVKASQNVYLDSFKAYARPEHARAYGNIVSGSAVDQADRWAALAIEKNREGGFGVDPNEWFAAMTAKIDLMKQAEDLITEDVLVSSDMLIAENDSRVWVLLSLSLAVILSSLAISGWLARLTNRGLRDSIGSLREGSSSVSVAASQVAGASTNMAQASSEQSNAISECTQRLAEITEATQGNNRLCKGAQSITEDARKRVDACLDEMENLRAAMGAIKASGDEISAIIKTIDEIAFQTNLLALNAAVEAARAGEAGAGFAVVADEVRSLAQRSAQAANDTTQKIEDSIQRSNNGSIISGRVGDSLAQIVEGVRKVDEVVRAIGSASENQLQGIEEIAASARRQESAIMNATSASEETASAAEEMAGQAMEIDRTIADLAGQAGLQIVESGCDKSRSTAVRKDRFDGSFFRTDSKSRIEFPETASGSHGWN